MLWKDEGYLLSKTNFDENSIIVEAFTLNHGKYVGIVYGGSSRKQKKFYQVGNKISINWYSKGENKIGYFNIELIKPVSPFFFDDKKKTICILSACTILKILLPERQINKKIYNSFEALINNLNNVNWIKFYILWELSLIKELGFEVDLINKKSFIDSTNTSTEIKNIYSEIPKFLHGFNENKISNNLIRKALRFNKIIMMENFIIPNHLSFPISRNILESYYN